MQTYPLSQLTEETLNALVSLYERPDVSDKWDEMTSILDPEEIRLLNYLKSLLHGRQLVLMNEVGACYLSVVGPGRTRAYSSMGRRATQSYLRRV